MRFFTDQVDAKLIKRKKELKDPAIQDGKPLPDNGICKHYKKSYRWLRFPCCGKCYPCDLCHNEKEGDHDMKFAVRMLCGHCAKEQVGLASSLDLKVSLVPGAGSGDVSPLSRGP